MGHLKEIPKRFEISGQNAAKEFQKYLNDITDLANKANVTVKYKVKVETAKPEKRYRMKKEKSKKRSSNKLKQKKFNIPLKKKSMKLSNFELVMRKHVEELSSRTLNDDDLVPATTEKMPLVFTTRSLRVGKYRPIITHFRTNYTKIVRPVRNKIITLTA